MSRPLALVRFIVIRSADRGPAGFTNVHFGYVSVGEQSAAKVNERASERRFICEVREEPQLCGGTLSFVIRGGDRLSAVVRFGSNMSYVRGKPAAGWLPRTPGRSPRTIGGCINVRRSRRRKGKGERKESNNNNLDNGAMSVDRREGKAKEMREGGRTATRGSMEEKGRDRKAIVTARMCVPWSGTRCTDEPIMS